MPATEHPAGRLRRALPGFLTALALTAAALLAAAGESRGQEDAAPPPAVRTEAQYAALVDAVIAAHVRPAYERFARDADLLAVEVEALCASPSAPALESARRAFEAAGRGYFALLPTRFGPLLEENRQERLAFWPDPRGLGLKQVQKLIAKSDPSVLDPVSLAGKSVAVQGLTALEFLLSGTGSDALAAAPADGGYRCGYARAITLNVVAIAAELSSAWEEGGSATALWTAPGPANPLFQTHKEAAGKIVVTVAAGLEVVVETMLAGPFGDGADRARPRLAPLWRSGQSMAAATAALEATQHLVEVSGALALLDPREAWLGNSILFELNKAIEGTRGITAPIDVAVADEPTRGVVRYLVVAIHSLKRAIGRELATSIGLEQGFNANDGD